MPKTEEQPEKGAEVRYHLVCPYHKGIGAAETLDEANELAHQHIMDQHVDSNGSVAPGADIQIQEKRHYGATQAIARQAAAKSDKK
jgi:hypothetical protein